LPARVLLIALDAYDKDLLLPWAAAGELPTLGRLLREATWGVTEAPAAVYAGAVWPSFNTGTSPAHHRRFFRRQARRGEYLDADFLPKDIVGRPFWEFLSDAGRRVAVIDAPHAQLSQRLNGFQLVDWAVHEPEVEQGLTCPPSLRQEILANFDREPPDQCETTTQTIESHRSLRAHLEARLRNKAALSRHYLESEDWDFFFTTFGEAHCGGHQWWHLHDPTHPAHDARLAAALGDVLKELYIEIDRAAGDLIAGLDPQTRLIVFCSHGMGPLYGESVALDEVLRRLEPPKAAAGSLFNSLKRCWYMLPPTVRALSPARNLRLKMQRSLHESLLVPDRQQRRFFAIPHNPHGGAIRINVVGRETHGRVQPGDEYRSVCAELREELLALRCPETGDRVAVEVAIVADLYDGPFVDELPDVVVEWSRRRPLRSMSSPRIGTVPIPEIRGRTGDHKRAGLFLARGPGLSERRLQRSVPIVDLPPTLMSWLDVPVPPHFAGRAIEELSNGRAG
jgi:predicted AlkP superfamily phosphohydrolase/phosphomutase